jgi:hypothetical protein
MPQLQCIRVVYGNLLLVLFSTDSLDYGPRVVEVCSSEASVEFRGTAWSYGRAGTA